MYPVLMQKLMSATIAVAISFWRSVSCCFGISSGFSSASIWCGPCVKRDLYRPKWRPDGDVDVFSFQTLIFPLKSSKVIMSGSISRSEAARHASSSA